MEALWRALGGDIERAGQVRFVGERVGLSSPYDVHGFAEACVAVAALAVCEFAEARRARGPGPRGIASEVQIDRRHVAAAFRSERHLVPVGWGLPPAWDLIAGDYRTRDGWIRLHTNYAWHREPVLRVLGVAAERAAVSAAVSTWDGESLEAAVVAAGGCAALCRTPAEWAAHAQGRAVTGEALIAFTRHPPTDPLEPGPLGDSGLRADRQAPLSGLRILDLTRVIAGPVATRFLASCGADVLRIDPPLFDEVAALLPDTTWGKRCGALDLRAPGDRSRFLELVTGAHVLVHGFRKSALPRLGLDVARLRTLNPGLVMVGLNAYGATGPWSDRRGFDSLVQMSTGIADTGRRSAGGDCPVPLPAQALDHGTGYLAAAAVVRGLTERLAGEVVQAHLSLARTAAELARRGDQHDLERPVAGQTPPRGPLTDAETAPFLDLDPSEFGPVHHVRAPVSCDGAPPCTLRPAGPLGRHPAVW